MYQSIKTVGGIPLKGFLKKVTLSIVAVAFVTVGSTVFSSATGKEIPFLELKTTEAACYGSVSVSGYYRSNGTYVRSHSRSCPDSSVYNNYSYSGNYNPNTSWYSSGRTSSYSNNYYSSPSYSSYGSGYGSDYSGYGSSYSSYGSGYGSSYSSYYPW